MRLRHDDIMNLPICDVTRESSSISSKGSEEVHGIQTLEEAILSS